MTASGCGCCSRHRSGVERTDPGAAARPVPRFVDRHTHVAALVRQYRALLGEAQHRDFPLLPSPSQRIAVGQSANIRSFNVYNDPDDVVRRIPLSVVVDGETQPSMAVELAARALGAPATMISGSRVPSQIPNTMTLNFEAGPDPIPTYSLADLRACIDKGDSDFFRRNFADKVVLIATVLDGRSGSGHPSRRP